MAEDMKVEKTDKPDKADKPKKKTVSVGDVLAKDKAPKSDAKSKGKRKHKHTMIEHHSDGSHTVRHAPMGGGDEVSYAAPDLDAVKSGLDANVGGGSADMSASPAPEAAPQPMAQPQPQAV